MTEEEEILRTLNSIDGHLDVLEKYVDDSRALAESGKGNLKVLKELNDKLTQVVEYLRGWPL